MRYVKDRPLIQFGIGWLIGCSLLMAASMHLSTVQAGECSLDTLAAFADETITVSSTALGFSAGNYEGQGNAQMALVSIETNAIRWFANGSTPTASVGHPGAVGATITVCGISNIKKFRMIRQTSDATATVSYFK